MSKRPSFIQRCGRQHINRLQTLLTTVRNQFHTTPPLICEERNTKRLVLVIYQFLGQFVNTWTADFKYSRYNRENIWQKDPMQISRKPKTFSEFSIAFLKSTLNLEYFERKDQAMSLSITEIINCETGSYLNFQKAIFHATLPQTTC